MTTNDFLFYESIKLEDSNSIMIIYDVFSAVVT